MEFKLILIFYILGNINTIMFKTEKSLREYCFFKTINSNDQFIFFNFASIGEKKEVVQAVLRQLTPERKVIHSLSQSEPGFYKTNPLQSGKYDLCFYPTSTNIFSINFNFYSSEDGEFSNIATDTQFKVMKVKMDDINIKMTTLENNAHNLVNTKFSHFLYLSDYIREIKFLTFIKILIVAIVSIFQIYVIQKMFGDDKRMSTIKTSKNINSKSDFL